MLINLSNHPAAGWSEKQTAEAIHKYKQITDLPFPVIDPHWTSAQVTELAQKYAKRVIELITLPTINDAVLLSGEYTFTIALFQILQAQNIRCLCACTQRNVVEKGKKKVSIFNFIQFREYLMLDKTRY